MHYSITKRKMGVGPKKGTTMYVARAVCQKQRVTFDKLCEFMADGSTVSQADVAAVFYKFRTVLNLLCSQGNIVDAGPLGTFRPTFTAKAVEKEEDFKPATHIKKLWFCLDQVSISEHYTMLSILKFLLTTKQKAKRNLKVAEAHNHTHKKCFEIERNRIRDAPFLAHLFFCII